MNKREILEKSIELITGDREQDYGDAAANFGRISDLWSVVLGMKVQPWQVAACMLQVKIARAIKSPTHLDSWVDAGGYVGLGAELALSEPLADWERELLEAEHPPLPEVGSVEWLDILPIGARVKDCDGDEWEKLVNGSWHCDADWFDPKIDHIEAFAPYTLVSGGSK